MHVTFLTVERAGLTTIQDGGRAGLASIGVPNSGAWHRTRYDLASLLVSGGCEGLVPTAEVLAGTLRLRARRTVAIAVVGPAQVQVNGAAAPLAAVIEVRAEDVVDVHAIGPGPAYLGIAGWQHPRVLGSASFDTFSALGGGPVSVGDEWRGEHPEENRVGWFAKEVPDPVGPVRVVPTMFAPIEEFAATTWRVERTARSGVRLRAPSWSAPTLGVASMPMVPGSIQLTPDGEAIVLGPDGALTGGYPVIAVVATADLDRLSTLQPGSPVRFTPVDVAWAARALSDRSRPLLVHPDDLT